MTEGVRAWYRDDSEDNLKALHMANPGQMLTADDLLREAGLKYSRVENPNDPEVQRKLGEGCSLTDFNEVSREAMGDQYEEKVRLGYMEHFHEDGEMRLMLEGSGYFEVRTYDDRWVRVHVRAGDLLDFPPAIYHRFTFDDAMYIRMFRMYREIPEWKGYYRSPESDAHPARAKFFATRPHNRAQT